jgi:hypothetical protein
VKAGIRTVHVRAGSSYDADHDIIRNSQVALHNLFGEPAYDSANHDRSDPADCLIFHGRFSHSIGVKLFLR